MGRTVSDVDNRAEVREFLTSRRAKMTPQQLATNHLGRAMHASVYDSEAADPPNFARYTFLHDDSHRFNPDWDGAADICVAILRTEAGRDPPRQSPARLGR